MTFILSLPLAVRVAGLFLVGIVLGGQLNRGIYGLAYNPRPISPWGPSPDEAARRHRLARLPLIGWWWLRCESPLHGQGFWVRPILIELFTGAALAALYVFEVHYGGVYPPAQRPVDPATLHAQFLAHAILLLLMTVATFIDFDEQTIPDTITLPGLALGLAVVIAFPNALMPLIEKSLAPHHLVLTSSNQSEAWLDGLGGAASWPPVLNSRKGLMLAAGLLLAWWLVVLPKLWVRSRGWWKAWQLLIAHVVRRKTWVLPTIVLAVALGLVSWAYGQGGDRWEAALTAVIGMAAGGALVWGVRLVGTFALRAEAMGFGDVTLMAMIGAFLGWQSTLLVFFYSPFAALLIAVTQWALTRRHDIAFGPYLCLSALVVIVAWNQIWSDRVNGIFSMGWFVPIVVGCGLLMMGGMLSLYRMFRDWVHGPEE